MRTAVLLLVVSLTLPSWVSAQSNCVPSTITTTVQTVSWDPVVIPTGQTLQRQILERIGPGDSWRVIAEVPVGIVEFTDTGLEHGYRYTWRLTLEWRMGDGTLRTSPLATYGTPQPCVTVNIPVTGAKNLKLKAPTSKAPAKTTKPSTVKRR